jgi:alkaline phosphatase
MKSRSLLQALLLWTLAASLNGVCLAAEARTGNVIFIHVDGAGVNSWNACRLMKVGPDGEIGWDRIPRIGIYRGHMKDGLTATSHGGATTHAYGVKVPADSYGMDGRKPLRALSGFPGSIMQEAQQAGKAVGVINTGHIGEPGTGAFLASAASRNDIENIAAQVVRSGAHVILSGGEKYLLPAGQWGFHGIGVRQDGRDLIARSKSQGYTVVYTGEQLGQVDFERVDKLLGVFAAEHTFNDRTEEQLEAAVQPLYSPSAAALEEMLSAALKILTKDREGFLLVAEAEGPDNFGNVNNARGVLEALKRADAAYETTLKFLEKHPETLLITTADSDAGGLQVVAPGLSGGEAFPWNRPLTGRMRNGAPLDGPMGTRSPPFISAPDRNRQRHAFGVAFAAYCDVAGGIVTRAAGLNSDRFTATVDNTDIYRLMYLTLFGRTPEPEAPQESAFPKK